MTRSTWVPVCLVYVVNLLTGSMGDVNCIYQVCQCDVGGDESIWCDNRQLQAIPPVEGTNLGSFTSLIFDSNQITAIKASDLPPDFVRISFNENPISSIDSFAFAGSALSLRSIAFSYAQLTSIPEALLEVQNLQDLQIDISPITDWTGMLHFGPTLQRLILTNVSLATWPEWLHSYVQLTELSLVNCMMSVIPDNAFDSMVNTLVSLTLTGNRLTSVPKAMAKMTGLQQLFLDGNLITDTRWLPPLSRLETLSLNDNRIFNATQLSQTLRPFISSLGDIDLVNNRLTVIPELDFLSIGEVSFNFNLISNPLTGSFPPSTGSLDLSHNLLPAIPNSIAVLKSIESVWLTNNVIRVIEARNIPTTAKLLELGYNLITEISDNNFPLNNNLNSLNLNNNPLVKISLSAFDNLIVLDNLDISSTRLARLPLAISSLTHLTALNAEDIGPLVCTCQEKSLAPIISSIMREEALGSCGLADIYDFFTFLSPDCPPLTDN